MAGDGGRETAEHCRVLVFLEDVDHFRGGGDHLKCCGGGERMDGLGFWVGRVTSETQEPVAFTRV